MYEWIDFGLLACLPGDPGSKWPSCICPYFRRSMFTVMLVSFAVPTELTSVFDIVHH